MVEEDMISVEDSTSIRLGDLLRYLNQSEETLLVAVRDEDMLKAGREAKK